MPVKKTQRKKTENAQEETETFKVEGSKIVEKIKEIIKEGNVRRIIIKDKTGKELMQFPLTFGVIGVAVAPMLAAVGALTALITECTITVVREKS